MRQLLIAILAVLAVPAMAGVTITVTNNGDCTATVGYTTDGEIPRAFALDISVDGGATIDAIGGFIAGESTDGAEGFGIFPGAFDAVIDPANPNWADAAYTPVAPAGAPGSAGVIGGSAITVELGSLYDAANEQPGTSGALLTITVSGACNVSVAANTTRAATGVVLEDTTDAVVTLPAATAVTCQVGPACWSYPCFIKGDGNGDGFLTAGDVMLIINAWGGYAECADFNKDGFITAGDIMILINNWSAGC